MTVSALFKHLGFGWLSLSLLGIVVGMFAAFADRPFGGALIIASIISFVFAFAVISYVGELTMLLCLREGKSR